MQTYHTSRSRFAAVVAVLCLVMAQAASALGGGNVLPPNARPHGYSLTAMAAATAIFNTGSRLPETLPDTPFQILYFPNTGPLVVRPGTSFYVPLFYSDDSLPILGDFPNVHNQAAVADYLFSQDQIGLVLAEIVVDGKVTSLGRGYAVGADTAPLPDGGGTHYITIGAFLTPLSKGTHTITIRILATGDALLEFPDFFPGGIVEFETTYTVIVR